VLSHLKRGDVNKEPFSCVPVSLCVCFLGTGSARTPYIYSHLFSEEGSCSCHEIGLEPRLAVQRLEKREANGSFCLRGCPR